jgi:ABC-type multidrug transport system ATPase subunit
VNIELDNVSVVYSQWGTSKTALKNVSLKIAAGSLVWITGPNGSGKTTLLSAIAGETASSTGQVRIGDSVVDTKSPPYRQVFLVPQNPMRGTVSTLSVFEHMLLAEPNRRVKRPAARDSARVLLQSFSFDVNLDQRADSLSGGQRQMLSLLLALKRLPPVILLDEPTSALDTAHATHAKHIIREMCACKRTVLIVSHGGCFDAEAAPQRLFVEDGRVTTTLSASLDSAPAASS